MVAEPWCRVCSTAGRVCSVPCVGCSDACSDACSVAVIRLSMLLCSVFPSSAFAEAQIYRIFGVYGVCMRQRSSSDLTR